MLWCGIVGAVLVCSFNLKCSSIGTWDITKCYNKWGHQLTLAKMFEENFGFTEPANYSKSEMESLMESYENELLVYDDEEFPNVVVVMNESFSDLKEVYDIDFEKDPLEFYRTLKDRENVVSGIVHSSVFGGKTANIEYEFLTQNTTAFMPTGAMPFQQYIYEPVKNSIVSTLEILGYSSLGMHSWNSSGYSRKYIYGLFGFDNILFKENMKDLKFNLDGYSTDISTYEKWFEIMDNKKDGEKEFSFIVTMQNHVPYNMESGENYVSEDKKLNVYLQRLKDSDDALEDLIEYIDAYEEKVILLFFGDHQPFLNQGEYEAIVDEEEAMYMVPFVMYANFEIEEKRNVETSANYLQSILLEVAGLPFDEHTNYIKALRKDLPVITANYYIDSFGNRYFYDDLKSPWLEKLEEYKKVIWYYMFEN